jgi:hypothetical protein
VIFRTCFIIPHNPACQPESINMLLEKISRTIERLRLGVNFSKIARLLS